MIDIIFQFAYYLHKRKKNQTLAYGARVEWAEPEYDDEDDD